jgi:two-component system response regulator DctR
VLTEIGAVHIVDDDAVIRDALAWLCASRGLKAVTYASAEDFLERYSEDRGPCCLLLDIRMSGMSGLELQDKLRELNIAVPIIFLTGHADVPLAVNALKHGAHDFLEKPFNDNELVDRLIDCLEHEAKHLATLDEQASIAERLSSLTPREREVMELMLAGKYNKVIADELKVTTRTVEVHRARLLEKMGVRSALELAQLLAARSR